MSHIALVTCDAYPELDVESQPLLPALQAVGLTPEIVSWTNPDVQWHTYDMVLLRSTWDYHTQREAFITWANRVAQQAPLYNPAALIAWNTDKRYLQQLEQHGVAIVPTCWVEQGSTNVSWTRFLDTLQSARVVIKPTVSAAGLDTWLLDADSLPAHQTEIELLLQHKALMVQPYFASVETAGELSLYFFNRQFSHALVKKPAPQQFKVQEMYGGHIEYTRVNHEQRMLGLQVIDVLPDPLLYARVDLMRAPNGQWVLSELEVTEPSLYLTRWPQATQHVVQAIQQTLAQPCKTGKS